MAFIDLNLSIKEFSTEGYDITIVGAGAAGILLAVKLSAAGKNVLLIESGHFTETDEKQQLNEIVQTGKFLNNSVWGRKRVLGGTTTAWGGQSLPFTSFDFEKKNWVPLSGWPISYKQIEPYYSVANQFMKIDGLNYTVDIFSKIKLVPPQIDQRLLHFHVSKWAKEPNFFTLYKSVLQQHVTVIYNAQLTGINKNYKGNVANITVANFTGDTCTISPGQLILATGTIESIRILLTNHMVSEPSKNWLGKCFMDHPCVEVGNVFSADPYKLQQLFNTHVANGRKYSIRLSLSENVQSQFKLLNCSASIMFKPKRGSFDIYDELKLFLKKYKTKRLMKILGSGGTILKSAFAYYKHKFYYKANAEAKLVLMIEQEPLLRSSITLADTQDRFGVAQVVLNWDISSKTWSTVIKISQIIGDEFKKLNIGTVQLYPFINVDNGDWMDSLTDVNHHMGGARMSEGDNGGVVDKDLKLWGVSNLYVCSSAVFPTTSHSNPTLTLLALAARLTEHLLQKSSYELTNT